MIGTSMADIIGQTAGSDDQGCHGAFLMIKVAMVLLCWLTLSKDFVTLVVDLRTMILTNTYTLDK